MSKTLLKIIILTVLFCSVFLNPDLPGIYKKGEIKLVPDPEFGKGMDWESMFYDWAKRIAIAGDGSIFVANSRQHNIQKFDKSGQLLLTFGQKGQGPGDFLYPGDLSILDEKYLVVAEYATNRRVSFFDLNGKFIKLIKTEKPVNGCLALKNNKVVLQSYKHLNEYDRKKEPRRMVEIFILDIETKEKVLVTSSLFHEQYKIFKNNKKQRNSKEDFFLKRTKAGNLLVGFSSKKDIHIYNPEGKEIKSFTLNIMRKKITREIKEKRVEQSIKGLENDTRVPKSIRESFIKYFKTSKDEVMNETPDYFYYYYDIKIDSSGNIMVLLNNKMMSGYDENWLPQYQIYSPEGIYKGEVKISYGNYKPVSIFKKFRQFHGDSLVGLFERKDTDDIVIELLKMSLQ